jgi:hypothetical protein
MSEQEKSLLIMKAEGPSEALACIYTSLHSAHPRTQLPSSIFIFHFAVRTFLSPF